MAKKKPQPNISAGVLTIRIDENLDKVLDEIIGKKRMTKASLIRNYLNLAKYIRISDNSIKSINKNYLIMFKRSFIKKILESLSEDNQVAFGTELAQFINDLARIEDNIENLEYKLDMCEKFGFFENDPDKGNYILFTKEFGPERFVDAFAWHLITMGDQGEFDKEFRTEIMDNNKKVKSKYINTIQPVRRDASHYAYEFAKIKE